MQCHVHTGSDLVSLVLVNIFTFAGVVCFFVDAAMLIPATRPEPSELSAPA